MPAADEGDWKGASWKQEEDYSKETDELLKEVCADEIPVLLRASGKSLDDLLVPLFALEKKARLGGDTLSNQRIAVEIIRIFRTQGKDSEMMGTIEQLMKRRAQPKQVQSAIVQEATLALQGKDVTEARRREVLELLNHATEGKIHVELEHGRFTIQLAQFAEQDGNKKEAVNMLAVIQVETITSMPRLEKLDALMTQLRLTIETGDFVSVPICSRKVNYRALGKKDTKEVKVTYFTLMAQYFLHHDAHLLVARCFNEIYLTLENEDDKLNALSNVVAHCLVAKHMSVKELGDLGECAAFSPQSRQADRTAWLTELAANKRLSEELETMHSIVKAFNSVELIRLQVQDEVGELISAHPVFAGFEDRQEQLRSRVSEHDLLVIAKYYKRIKIARLAELVGLTAEHVEQFLMHLVASGNFYAKIDRIDGIVVFERRRTPTEVESEWHGGVTKMVGLIDKAAHLIVKERMAHHALPTA